jgi:hypothetical protein
MPRFFQVVLISSMLALSWLLMQVIHELGHVAAAWASGGTVTKVVLHPLTISRTDVEPNPQPLVVAWGGPIVGVVLPLALWSIAAALRVRSVFLVRFFAGLCLLANGLYLGVGSFNAIGDAGDILHHGSPIWFLWLFALGCVPAGLLLWNGTGRHFGLGDAREFDSPMLVYGCVATLAAVVVLEVVFSGQ